MIQLYCAFKSFALTSMLPHAESGGAAVSKVTSGSRTSQG